MGVEHTRWIDILPFANQLLFWLVLLKMVLFFSFSFFAFSFSYSVFHSTSLSSEYQLRFFPFFVCY